MTNDQKQAMHLMRGGGIGYTKIAKKLGMPENTVKSFCKRNSLGGVAAAQPKTNADIGAFCLNCGKPLVQETGKKQRKFCSDKCRTVWLNSHPERVKKKAIYYLVYAKCGKPFKSYNIVFNDCFVAHCSLNLGWCATFLFVQLFRKEDVTNIAFRRKALTKVHWPCFRIEDYRLAVKKFLTWAVGVVF